MHIFFFAIVFEYANVRIGTDRIRSICTGADVLDAGAIALKAYAIYMFPQSSLHRIAPFYPMTL